MTTIYKTISSQNLEEFNLEMDRLFDAEFYSAGPLCISSVIDTEGKITTIYAQQFIKYVDEDLKDS